MAFTCSARVQVVEKMGLVTHGVLLIMYTAGNLGPFHQYILQTAFS